MSSPHGSAESTEFTDAGTIPVNERVPIMTYGPVVLDVPGRPVPLEIKVSWPAEGNDLPILLFSHGHGTSNFLSSLNGYGPLTNFWAAHGFAVVQPSHLDGIPYGLRDTNTPDAPLFWRQRALDMSYILDHLDELEKAVPSLTGRLDRGRIVTAGHSLGGTTVTSLMGMRVLDPEDDRDKDLSDTRLTAGVAIAALGVADEDLDDWAKTNYPMTKWLNFSTMTGTTLAIAGDKDLNPHFSHRLSYRWDDYTRSPAGNKTLLTFFGANHMFGGISGYDAAETGGENPPMVSTLRAMVWAYLWSQLYPENDAWQRAVAALETAAAPLGTVETR